MTEARVRLNFRNATDGQIVAIANSVLEGMTNNAAFPRPPVDLSSLRSALDQFNKAIANQPAGGKAATAFKRQCREAVLQLLRQIAHYVDENCFNNPAVLRSSGFDLKSMNRAKSALPKAVILSVKRGRTTELVIKVKAISNSKVYEIRYAVLSEDGTPGPWQDRKFTTNSRVIPVAGLTPGKVYALQARAIGGTAGYSDWSDSVSHMCI